MWVHVCDHMVEFVLCALRHGYGFVCVRKSVQNARFLDCGRLYIWSYLVGLVGDMIHWIKGIENTVSSDLEAILQHDIYMNHTYMNSLAN